MSAHTLVPSHDYDAAVGKSGVELQSGNNISGLSRTAFVLKIENTPCSEISMAFTPTRPT